jgi:hypothetical protein
MCLMMRSHSSKYILGCTELYTSTYLSCSFSPVVGKGVDRIVCKLGLPYLVCSSYRGVAFRVFP